MENRFGDRLRVLRQEQGLHQRDLERALNLRPGAVSQYERGLREPGFTMLVALADYLEVSTDFLLGRPEAVQESPALGAARRRLQDLVRRRPLRGARPRDRFAFAMALAAAAAPELFALTRLAHRLGVGLPELESGTLPPAKLRRLATYLGLPLG